MRLFRFLAETVEANLYLVRDYSKLISGSLGRLVLSLAYFTAVANTLSVADFGLFATASGTGVVLSRIAGLGFVSPLYRAATRKPQLVGVYTAGYLAALALSLPLVVLAAAGFYLGVFRGDLALLPFALIIVAEVVFWRSMEVVCIVNNGLGRFGRASLLVIGGTAAKSLAALLFSFGVGASGGILAWSAFYLGANAVAALAGIALIYPRQRLRLRPRLYLRRASDSFAVAGAEVLFYLQSEMDKILVLSIGGPQIAGVYAMLMRLIDLTALPIRSFNTMAVQKLMRAPAAFSSRRMRWGIEGGIALVSVAGMAGLGLVLLVAPTLLGRNVADAAPLVLVAIAVPAFRNLVEYESELLYARGLTGTRAGLLALLGLMKAGLLTMLLTSAAKDGGTGWIAGLNGVFATLWLTSAMTAYTAMDARRAAPRLSWRRRKARRLPG
ncbi:lipopolysaccharide biosynthesis protein [Aureimonas pseudogalii]|uniref:O-antigen/teichoic acid export membrane protein n=1 Tax=Aureimonas pseudogalii TaxID=1744844 RepID=A0A7W6H2U2_9HYPH|nr:lipopolysaccharide biosynthesis protein [Aureimonas pseudogalii]MBB3997025.1 O-antigen/teichoic acid export membrane protein [Aureimonas pseudogalii]